MQSFDLAQGPEPGQFILLSPDPSGAIIPAGGSINLDFAFDPASEGAKNALLTVLSDSGNRTAMLSGVGALVDPCLVNDPAMAAAVDDYALIGTGSLILLGILAGIAVLIDFVAGLLGARRVAASGKALWAR